MFPLLFFKWISDTWDWEHAQAIVDFGAEVTAEEEADYHRFDGTALAARSGRRAQHRAVE